MSDIESPSGFREAVHDDLEQANWAQKVGFYATAGALAVHEIGMETAIAATYFGTAEMTGQAWPAIAAVGALSLGAESALSAGVARVIGTFGRTTQYLEETYFVSAVETEAKPSARQRVVAAADTALLAAGLGAPGIIMREYARNPSEPVSRYRKAGLKAAGALATVNMAYAGVAAGTSALSEQLGIGEVARVITDIGESPITYPTIMALVVGRTWHKIHSTVAQRHQREATATKDQELGQ